jgi:hypothetical protein
LNQRAHDRRAAHRLRHLLAAPFARSTTAAPFTVPASGTTDFGLQLTADLVTALKVLGQHLGDRERLSRHRRCCEGVLRCRS